MHDESDKTLTFDGLLNKSEKYLKRLQFSKSINSLSKAI